MKRKPTKPTKTRVIYDIRGLLEEQWTGPRFVAVKVRAIPRPSNWAFESVVKEDEFPYFYHHLEEGRTWCRTRKDALEVARDQLTGAICGHQNEIARLLTILEELPR